MKTLVDIPQPVEANRPLYTLYKNEMSDYISRNSFDALIGQSSEALAKEAFQHMDVQLICPCVRLGSSRVEV